MNTNSSLQVKGNYCIVDYSLIPNRKNWANEIVDYMNEIVPKIFHTVQLAIPKELILIYFKSGINGAMFVYDISKGILEIQVGTNVDVTDYGFLIHECVHWAQQYDQSIYNQRMLLYEGMADYFRIIHSRDKMGDCGSKRKLNLIAKFSKSDLYDSGSEFLAYLKRSSGDKDFIIKLFNVMRSNNLNTIDTFSQTIFDMSFEELLKCYAHNRIRILGSPPEKINRFEYFTNMI